MNMKKEVNTRNILLSCEKLGKMMINEQAIYIILHNKCVTRGIAEYKVGDKPYKVESGEFITTNKFLASELLKVGVKVDKSTVKRILDRMSDINLIKLKTLYSYDRGMKKTRISIVDYDCKEGTNIIDIHQKNKKVEVKDGKSDKSDFFRVQDDSFELLKDNNYSQLSNAKKCKMANISCDNLTDPKAFIEFWEGMLSGCKFEYKERKEPSKLPEIKSGLDSSHIVDGAFEYLEKKQAKHLHTYNSADFFTTNVINYINEKKEVDLYDLPIEM